jgi:hypothetical protein
MPKKIDANTPRARETGRRGSGRSTTAATDVYRSGNSANFRCVRMRHDAGAVDEDGSTEETEDQSYSGSCQEAVVW